MKLEELISNVLSNVGNRTDLTAEASAAISNAVKHYGRERFHFLENIADLTTTASQAWYITPTDLGGAMDVLNVTLNGSKNPLIRTHYADIDSKDDGITYGQPSQWAYYKDNIRLYPVPDAAYVITLSYHKNLAEPTASGSNVWTGIASQLIEHRATWDIWAHTLRNVPEASTFKNSEMESYLSLMGETTKKVSTGRLKKSGW